MSKSKKPVVRGWVPRPKGGTSLVPEVHIGGVSWLRRLSCGWSENGEAVAYGDYIQNMRPATPAELKLFLAEIAAVKAKQSAPPSPTKPSVEEVARKLLEALEYVQDATNASLPKAVWVIVREAIAFSRTGGIQ